MAWIPHNESNFSAYLLGVQANYWFASNTAGLTDCTFESELVLVTHRAKSASKVENNHTLHNRKSDSKTMSILKAFRLLTKWKLDVSYLIWTLHKRHICCQFQHQGTLSIEEALSRGWAVLQWLKPMTMSDIVWLTQMSKTHQSEKCCTSLVKTDRDASLHLSKPIKAVPSAYFTSWVCNLLDIGCKARGTRHNPEGLQY